MGDAVKTYERIMPEYGEQFAPQPDDPLPTWPDGSLKQLDPTERTLNWRHLNGYHDTPTVGCYSCLWEDSI